jgi:hypothetical protein
MNMRDELTVKERVQLANRRLQMANMLQQGEVGHDGRYGDWRCVESRTGFKLAMAVVLSGCAMAYAAIYFAMLMGWV